MGVLITSLIPIYDHETKELVAVLGMDIDADDWNKIIIFQSMVPISLTLFILLLIIYLYMLNTNRQMIKLQYAEKKKLALELQNTLKHVKKLQGILPMCSKCKSIRDNKGYWNQIESYLSEHSEAILSTDFVKSVLKNYMVMKLGIRKAKKMHNKTLQGTSGQRGFPELSLAIKFTN